MVVTQISEFKYFYIFIVVARLFDKICLCYQGTWMLFSYFMKFCFIRGGRCFKI